MASGTFNQLFPMIILLALSAFFSATETSFSSLNRTRLKSLADHGNKKALSTLKTAERYDELLSSILICNNIVNIALASLSTMFFVNWLGGNTGVSVSTAVSTVMVLIFGEITPKSMAKETPEKFAMAVTPVVRVLMALLHPINWLFGKWKALLCRLVKTGDDRKLTQDELITMVEEVEQDGGMNAEESELLRSAIEFNDLDVSDILTPRVRVEGVPLDATAEEIAALFEESGYSRLPVYEETLDKIVGVVHQKDFYPQFHKGCVNLRAIMKTPVFVPESVKINDLLHLLQKTKSQMAVVADEYGGTVGIVTMEDILEELVGEIWDEHDEIEVACRQTQEGTWHMLGSAPVEALQEQFHLAADTDASTVGGWVMEMAERVPDAGDVFDCGEWQLTVLKADERHVLEIELHKKPASGAEAAAQPAAQ